MPTHSMSPPENTSPRLAPVCKTCTQREHCFLTSPLPTEDGDCAAAVQRRHRVARGAKLYHRNARFSSLYQVCSGALKTQRETPEGSLVITGFFLPGDVVGVEAIADTRYPCDAIAISDCEVCQLNFANLLTLCARRPGVHAWLLSRIGLYMRRKDTDLSWATGLQTHQRVLRFFLDMHQRLASEARVAATPIALPMQKQDIARYLHMTPETLSRNLARLRGQGLLQVEQDRFVLPDAVQARRLTEI